MFSHKNLCFIIVFVLLIFSIPVQVASADVPSLLSLSTSQSGTHTFLQIEIRHANPSSSHYVDVIELDINGEKIEVSGLIPQDSEVFSESYDLGEVADSFNLQVRAHCNIHGWSNWNSAIISPTPAPSYVTISVDEAKQLIDTNPNLVILDVRTVEEFNDGHIENAILIPVQELKERLGELDKNSEILVYCRTANRSAQASQILVDNGFTRVYNMGGGIVEWVEKGYPIIRGLTPSPTPTVTPTPGDDEEVDDGCIIATSTFGSALAPEVQFLRTFREETVYSTSAGTNFMTAFNAFYYSWSPAIAAQIWQSETLQAIGRIIITPLLPILHFSTMVNSFFSFNPELAIVLTGLAASSLIGIIYFMPITLGALYGIKKRNKSIPKAGRLSILTIPWIISILLIYIGELTTSNILLMAATGALVVLTIAITAGTTALKILRH